MGMAVGQRPPQPSDPDDVSPLSCVCEYPSAVAPHEQRNRILNLMRFPEHGLLKSEVSSFGTDRVSGQQETNRADKFDKPVDSLSCLGELQPEHGPFHWRVPGPYPKDRTST